MPTSDSPTRADPGANILKLRELIAGFHVAMLTTVAPNGALVSRPMGRPQEPFDGTLWFFTALDSGKADDINHEHQVNVSLAEPKESRYVSMSGIALVVRDRDRARELWNPFVQAWFPRGVDDPNLALLRVHVQRAEYWDSPQGRMVQLFELTRAALTGDPPRNLGEHARLPL